MLPDLTPAACSGAPNHSPRLVIFRLPRGTTSKARNLAKVSIVFMSVFVGEHTISAPTKCHHFLCASAALLLHCCLSNQLGMMPPMALQQESKGDGRVDRAGDEMPTPPPPPPLRFSSYSLLEVMRDFAALFLFCLESCPHCPHCCPCLPVALCPPPPHAVRCELSATAAVAPATLSLARLAVPGLCGHSPAQHT